MNNNVQKLVEDYGLSCITWRNSSRADRATAHKDMQDAKAALLMATAAPAPIEPTDAQALAFHRALTDGDIGSDELEDIKVGLRAAFAAALPAS